MVAAHCCAHHLRSEWIDVPSMCVARAPRGLLRRSAARSAADVPSLAGLDCCGTRCEILTYNIRCRAI